jgi:HD-GYP domain-containing protein (c-di-GMP phosphodiesterase class II)
MTTGIFDDSAVRGAAHQKALSFTQRLLQAIKVARLHELDNAALVEPMEGLRAVVHQLLDEHGAACARVEQESKQVFVNGSAVKARRQQYETLELLAETFEHLGVAEVRFVRPVTVEHVHAFLRVIRTVDQADAATPEARCTLVVQGLEYERLSDRIEVLSERQARERAVEKAVKVDESLYVRLAYARTLALVREYLKRLRDEELRRYFWRKLVKAVQGLAAVSTRSRNELLSLTLVKDADEPIFNRAVNTCILSILLGSKAGLSKTQLLPLGLGALLHGLGAFRAPDETDPAKRSRLALGGFLELGRVDDALLACALVAAEHEAATEAKHPYSRVVAICSTYDELTSRTRERPALPPDQALNTLLSGRPRAFDATLLALFVNLLGLYPPGTTVLLDTQEAAVVVHPNPQLPRRPVVAVIQDPRGRKIDGLILDLARRGKDGRYPHSISRVFDPRSLGLEIPEWLRA